MQLFQPTAQGIQCLSELMSFSGLTPSTFHLFSLNIRTPDLQITLKVFHMFTLASGKQKFFPYLPSQTKFLPQPPKPLKTASHCLPCSSLRGCMTLGSRRKDASPQKWRIDILVKKRGDKAEERQLFGLENCTVFGYQDTSTWTHDIRELKMAACRWRWEI